MSKTETRKELVFSKSTAETKNKKAKGHFKVSFQVRQKKGNRKKEESP